MTTLNKELSSLSDDEKSGLLRAVIANTRLLFTMQVGTTMGKGLQYSESKTIKPKGETHE